ncbi:hypothetical protein M408DRAFT_330528 [Serendipita vermifera MAFF 305830]|uniref:Uncharacterized protein n=1 Tax=Serendipita vermifera MAFF 305830 TaxID=933852 RepID=A0A0C2WJT6_SERVB|nr:hypothetical protein M408DRAFT_25284 [Serendipita vermifera MAFF 305830]KIM26578.1 hypothetical protein M408DRAFT_330528 [Serendipita vermifera MAFF 305830]
MQLLTLGRDPAITAAFLAQLEVARPGMYNAYTAHSPVEFRELAEAHKAEIDLVLLGAAQNDEQAKVARSIVEEVFGSEMRVIRLPGSLLTEEGKRGGMLAWFLQELEEGQSINQK